MAEQYWIVRAKRPTKAVNAVMQPTTLSPGQRGFMVRGAAVQAALKGDVLLLSPGGVSELLKAQQGGAVPKAAAPPAEAPVPVEAPLEASPEVEVAPPQEPQVSVAPRAPVKGPQFLHRRLG